MEICAKCGNQKYETSTLSSFLKIIFVTWILEILWEFWKNFLFFVFLLFLFWLFRTEFLYVALGVCEFAS